MEIPGYIGTIPAAQIPRVPEIIVHDGVIRYLDVNNPVHVFISEEGEWGHLELVGAVYPLITDYIAIYPVNRMIEPAVEWPEMSNIARLWFDRIGLNRITAVFIDDPTPFAGGRWQFNMPESNRLTNLTVWDFDEGWIEIEIEAFVTVWPFYTIVLTGSGADDFLETGVLPVILWDNHEPMDYQLQIPALRDLLLASRDGVAAQQPTAPTPDVITVTLNGQALGFDQPPVIYDGRTLVPLRAIFEALGADVEWDQGTQTVTATADDITVAMQIGNPVMTINNEEITLDVSPQLVGGRTLVPARAVAESFGAAVDWNAATRTVIITTE